MKSNCSMIFFIIIIFFSISADVGAISAESSSFSPDEVIKRLTEGNNRFASDKMEHPAQNRDQRNKTAEKGEHPVVTILACSDSYVPVEMIFDQGIGELFVIRVAGNVADTNEIGTAEYGAEYLGTPLLVVMGHTSCGAVTAVTKGDKLHGSIPLLFDNISPAAQKAKAKLGGTFSPELLDLATRNNIWQSIEDLVVKSEIIKKLISEKT